MLAIIAAKYLDLQAGDALRPVIFYIHGGAGKIMSAHDEGLSGEELARRHGFVYVAAQYRLGLFGFLAHPALSAEDERAAPRAREGDVEAPPVLDKADGRLPTVQRAEGREACRRARKAAGG